MGLYFPSIFPFRSKMSYKTFLANIWVDQPAFSQESGFRRWDERSTFQELENQPESYLERVVGISCGRRNLQQAPDFTFYPNLQFLELDDNNLKELPGLSFLTKLEVLKINRNYLTDISDVEKLTKLVRLDVDYNELAKLPELGHMKFLCSIHALPNPLQYTSSLPPSSQMDQRNADWYEKLVTKMEQLPLYRGESIQYSNRSADNKGQFRQQNNYQNQNFSRGKFQDKPRTERITYEQKDSVEDLREQVVSLTSEVFNLKQEIKLLKGNK